MFKFSYMLCALSILFSFSTVEGQLMEDPFLQGIFRSRCHRHHRRHHCSSGDIDRRGPTGPTGPMGLPGIPGATGATGTLTANFGNFYSTSTQTQTQDFISGPFTAINFFNTSVSSNVSISITDNATITLPVAGFYLVNWSLTANVPTGSNVMSIQLVDTTVLPTGVAFPPTPFQASSLFDQIGTLVEPIILSGQTIIQALSTPTTIQLQAQVTSNESISNGALAERTICILQIN